MNILREKLRSKGHHLAQFGGDSSSTSTQETNYSYTDNRSVSSVDDHSTHVLSGNNTGGGMFSVDRSFNTNSFNTTTTNTSVTQTDHGAVGAALQSNSQNTALLFALADKLMAGQKDIVNQNQTLTKELSAGASAAYEGATEQANGNKTLMLVAVTVVGVVAFVVWKGKN